MTKINGREFSRLLYVAEDVIVVDVITEKNVRSVQSGYGLYPKSLPELLGKKFMKDYQKREGGPRLFFLEHIWLLYNEYQSIISWKDS